MLASSNHYHHTPMEIVPMEPLFDEDWLHEHNLDILFDLFEEEVERKGLEQPATNHSSTIFGSSPVTSYLFGTSPPFASALDIYDLLYFDNNQQQPINNSQQQQSHNAAPTTTTSTTTSPSTTTNTSTTTTTTTNLSLTKSDHLLSANSQNKQGAPINNTKTYNVSGLANGSSSNLQKSVKQQQHAGGHQNVTNSFQLANSITNAMRIKRRLKKGQNEGISLLAKPLSNNNSGGSSSCSSSSSSISSMNNNNNSDKSSTKITTNLKKPHCNDNNNSTRGIDIKQQSHHNRNRHLHHIHHSVHYITGCSIIREHAYAVRGH